MRLPPLIAALALVACADEPRDERFRGTPYDAGPIPSSAARPEIAPQPAVVASGLSAPFGIVRLGDAFVVAERGKGRVVRVPVKGGEVTTLADGFKQPTWLATDGKAIVASDPGDGRIVAVSASGVVTPIATGQARPGRLRIAGDRVYWINEEKLDGAGAPIAASGSIHSAPLAGGAATELATGLHTPHDLALSMTHVYFTELGDTPRVASIPIAGGTPTTFATAYVPPMGLAIDTAAGELFFTTRDRNWPNGGWLFRAPLAGGVPKRIAPQPPYSDRVELDSNSVVWAHASALARVQRDGGTVENVGIETAVNDFVVGDGIAWTDAFRGVVLRK